MPLNLYATVNGFTTQEGTGDASPDNVRKIKNAGEYNAIVTVDLGKYQYGVTTSGFSSVVRVDVRNVLQNMLFVKGSTVVFARSTWLPASKTISDNGDYPHFRTGSTAESKNTLVLYIPLSVLSGTTGTDIKNYLSQNPLSVMYKSTGDTGEFYTGNEITQGDEYRCEIIDLRDRLHAGDTLETNVQSEYDAELIVDGAKVVSVSQTSSGNYRINLNVPDDFPVPEVGAVPNATANYLLPTAANTLQSFDVKGVFCAYLSAIYIVLEDQTVTAKEAAQSYFNDNPLRIFYKSASGGTGKNVRRETHVRKTLVLTGTENIQKSDLSNNSFYVNFDDIAQNGNVGSVICNQAKALAETDIVSSRIWGVSGSTTNQKTFRISSPETTVDAVKAKFAEQYSAGTPFIIEYELAQPEVFADDPIDIPVTALEVGVSGEGKSKVTYYIEPKYDKIKTDWKVQPPTPEGYYNGDWFELEDYVRIYNNLQTVKDLVKSIYGDFTFPTMITPVEGSPVFASQINILEEAIRAIRNKSIAIPEIPDPKTWTNNANLFTYEDINRWESVAIYYTAILMGVYELQPKLQFKLGGAQF